jgi:hypothetical protein
VCIRTATEIWERFWHNRVVVRIDGEMRRGRYSFILGRKERPLLDEIQVAFIEGKEDKVKEGTLIRFW